MLLIKRELGTYEMNQTPDNCPACVCSQGMHTLGLISHGQDTESQKREVLATLCQESDRLLFLVLLHELTAIRRRRQS